MSETLSLKIIFDAANNTGGVFSNINRKVNQSATGVQALNRQFNSMKQLAVGGFVANMAKGFFNLGASLENTQVGYEVMLKGAEQAHHMITAINTKANKTPYDNTDLYKVSETLLGFGVAHKKVMPYMSMLGDIARGNKERLSGLGLAFAQVQSAGKLSGQDLLQMINSGYNPLKDIAALTGKSMAQLKVEMSKGAISADMVANAMQRATSKGGLYYKMSEKIAQTGSGVASTALGKFKLAVSELSISAMPAMTQAIKDVTKYIDILGKYAKNNGDAVKTLISVAIKGVVAIGAYKVITLGTTLIKSVISTVGAFRKFLGVFRLMNIAMARNNVGQAARLVRLFGTSAKRAAEFIWAKNRALLIGNRILKLFRKQTWLAVGAALKHGIVSKAGAAFMWLKNGAMIAGSTISSIYSSATLATTALMMKQGVVTAALTVKQWALNVAMNANPIGIIISLIAALIGGVVYCYNEFAEFRAVLDTMWDTIKGFGESIIDFIIAPFEFLWELIKGIGNAIGSLFSGDGLEGAGDAISEGFDKGVEAGSARLEKSWDKAKDTALSIGDNYDKHLAEEEAKEAAEEAQMNPQLPDISKFDSSNIGEYDYTAELGNMNTNIAANSFTSAEQVREVQVNYQPTINVSGDMTEKSKRDLLQLLKDQKNELVKLVKEELKREQRLSYAR
ncbi:MAG: tape measure protein [Bacteroidales bacterium]|jgi:tape measure domain-containing protein|nr:tape measure protein [Bacteroidales bacterium]